MMHCHILFLIACCSFLPAAEWTLTGTIPKHESPEQTATLTVQAFALSGSSAKPALVTDVTIPAHGDFSCPLTIEHDGPFRANVCLQIPGYTQQWTRVWPNGEVRLKPLVDNTDNHTYYGVVRNKDGSPRKFETIWGDAGGTIWGFTDESGSFALSLPPTRNYHPPRFVIYAKDIIGGWYTLDPNSRPDAPKTFQPRPAHQAAVRCIDEFGQPLSGGIHIRSSGGGGSNTDEHGIAHMGSLYTENDTGLTCRVKNFQPIESRAFLKLADIKKAISDSATLTAQFTMGWSWHYTPQNGDIIVFNTHYAENDFAGCGFILQPSGSADEAGIPPIVVSPCGECFTWDQRSLHTLLNGTDAQRFDIYRLSNTTHQHKLATWVQAYAVTTASTRMLADKPPAMPRTQKYYQRCAAWVQSAINHTHTMSDETATDFQAYWQRAFLEGAELEIIDLADIAPFENAADTASPSHLFALPDTTRIHNFLSGKPIGQEPAEF